jgi:hypothetical protein
MMPQAGGAGPCRGGRKKISRACRSRASSFVMKGMGPDRPAIQPEENDMKVMVIVKATAESEAGILPSTELMEAMGRYNEDLVNAGVMLAGEGLKPTSQGARVHIDGERRQVNDGPFTETKELIAGFWLWQVQSLQEAIDWVKRCPNPGGEESEIEIRQVFEAEDFGPALTPELRAQEERLRAQLDAKR